MENNIIPRRLFTFGCSFTNYLWPTWADVLGTDYMLFNNWGWPGLGNRAIAERLAEAHTKFKLEPSDIVIVQWTSHLRNDWMHFRHPKDDYSNWRTAGSIFTEKNMKLYDKKWLDIFWDEKAYYIHTLNHILLAQSFLDGIGCEWYMTSMTDQSKISKEISGRTVNGEHPDEEGGYFDVWEKTPELMDYRERIWLEREDKWVAPILSVCKEQDHYWFKYDKNNPTEDPRIVNKNGQWMEPHPSVKQHVDWLLLLKERMQEGNGLSQRQQRFVDEFLNLKLPNETYNEFDAKIKTTEWGLRPKYRGF